MISQVSHLYWHRGDRCVKRLADLGAVVQKVQPSHQALACSRNTPLNTDHKSLATSHYLQHPCFTPYELPRHMGRGLDSRANGSFPQGAGRLSEKSIARHPPPHRRDGISWERGRPARILSLWPPLSFSAMLQAATLWAGTPSAKPKENHGAVAGRSKWRRWPRLCQALCGRDARAPGKPSSCGRDARAPGKLSSHDIVTPRAPTLQKHFGAACG